MATSLTLQNDASLAQGYVKVNGTTSATFTTSGITGNLTGNVTGSLTAGGSLTLATAQTATGTAVDFTGIPSWAKRITVIFNTVSTSGTSNFLVRLGAGSVDATSYESSAEYGGTGATDSTGLIIRNGGATNAHQGLYTLCLISSNLWIGGGVIRPGITGGTGTGGAATGYKPLSATLDRIRITTVNGTDTFDVGTINLIYEG